MTRSYAGDHFIPGAAKRPNYHDAVRVASRWFLPVGWMLQLQDAGVLPDQLDSAAAKVHYQFLRLGPPRGTTAVEIADRKILALRAGLPNG